MLFIDLEHELDHVEQILTRFIAQGVPFFTKVLEKNAQGNWKENPQYPGVLRSWQNDISEYHVRLIEFKRLHQRKINEETLRAHSDQLKYWYQRYLKATGFGKSKSRKAWEEQFFADIPALHEEVSDTLKMLRH